MPSHTTEAKTIELVDIQANVLIVTLVYNTFCITPVNTCVI